MVNWDEGDSAVYRALAEVAVPGRVEQIATALSLIPFGRDESFRIVDAGCGEGIFTYAALTAFQRATAIALDGSASMREHAETLLTKFGDRADVREFDLASDDWLDALDGAGCLASSLAVHHLSPDGKRALFDAAHSRLAVGGAAMIIDIVLPQRDEAWRLHADAYDEICRRQSIERSGDDALFARLVDERWNYFRHPDPAETPSPLSAQLAWLSDAGFVGVDCFWLQAGHAVFGGYKGGGAKTGGLSLADARSSVEAALTENRSI